MIDGVLVLVSLAVLSGVVAGLATLRRRSSGPTATASSPLASSSAHGTPSAPGRTWTATGGLAAAFPLERTQHERNVGDAAFVDGLIVGHYYLGDDPRAVIGRSSSPVDDVRAIDDARPSDDSGDGEDLDSQHADTVAVGGEAPLTAPPTAPSTPPLTAPPNARADVPDPALGPAAAVDTGPAGVDPGPAWSEVDAEGLDTLDDLLGTGLYDRGYDEVEYGTEHEVDDEADPDDDLDDAFGLGIAEGYDGFGAGFDDGFDDDW